METMFDNEDEYGYANDNPDAMDEDELNVILDRQVGQAMNQADKELSAIRTGALARYEAKKWGNERDGRSAYVSPDVFETIEWAHADVMRVFCSNDRYVAFKPLSPEDEKQAEQETDIVNHYLTQDGAGFLLMYDWTKDTLLYPNGYAFFGWENRDTIEEKRLEGLTGDQLAIFDADDDFDVLSHEMRTVDVPVDQTMAAQLSREMLAQINPETGTLPLPVFDVDIRRHIRKSRPKIRCLPPEQVLISPNQTGLDLDEGDFVGCWEPMTLSEIRQLGFDPDDVEAIKDNASVIETDYSEEKTERSASEDESPHTNPDAMTPASERYRVEYLFPRIDVDGDGVAERRHIVRVGHVILKNDVDDFQPIVAMSAVRVPHRHPGISYAQMCADIQLIKSTVLRNILDNVYSVNGRRKFVNDRALMDDGQTMRDLQDPNAEIVRVKGDPRAAIFPEQPTPIVTDLMPVVQYLDERKKTQTGVAPDLHLDPSVLQRTAAEAFAQAQTAANKRVEMVVRVMAETGMTRGFLKLRELLRTHQTREVQVKLHNRIWARATPSLWPDRDDVVVNVGLGFHNKERQLQMLFGILDVQLAKVAPFNLAPPKQVYATLEQIIETADIGDVSRYFVEPDPAKGWKLPEPPPPDPVMLAQAEVYKAQAEKFRAEEARRIEELKAKASVDMAKIQAEAEEARRKHALEMQKLQLEIEKARAEQWAAEQDRIAASDAAWAEVRNTEADTQKKLAEAEKIEREPANDREGDE